MTERRRILIDARDVLLEVQSEKPEVCESQVEADGYDMVEKVRQGLDLLLIVMSFADENRELLN